MVDRCYVYNRCSPSTLDCYKRARVLVDCSGETKERRLPFNSLRSIALTGRRTAGRHVLSIVFVGAISLIFHGVIRRTIGEDSNGKDGTKSIYRGPEMSRTLLPFVFHHTCSILYGFNEPPTDSNLDRACTRSSSERGALGF